MNVRQAQACDLQRLPVSMAMRSHLFSYRTQKLSSSAQMVLGWTRPGRVCRRRFPKQKAHTSVWAFCFVHDGNDFPWTAKQRSAEGKSATVRIVLLKRGVRERKDFPDAKGIHRVMGEPRAAHFAAQRRRARCMTRTRARESMSTPVSKRKNSHVSVSFFFCERCVKKAPREGK